MGSRLLHFLHELIQGFSYPLLFLKHLLHHLLLRCSRHLTQSKLHSLLVKALLLTGHLLHHLQKLFIAAG